MPHLCEMCDMKIEKSLYTEYTFNNVNLYEFDKILSHHICHPKKKI